MKKIIYTLIALFLPIFFFGQITWNGSISNDWQTVANWTGGIPIGTSNVIVPNSLSNYPIIDDGVTVAVCNNLTIGSAANVTIASNGRLTVNGIITNNAGISGLIIKSNASGTGSLIHSTASVNGSAERFLGGTQWHYVSTPINGVNSSEFNTLNFKRWDATMAWSGGINDDPWLTYSGTLANAQGYANYEAENTASLTGNLNQGAYNVSVFMNSTGIPQNDGWNLVGNPYPSAIDWTQVNYTSANLDQAISFWTGTTYASWTSGGGINGGTQYIPQGQGFFVRCNNAAGGTLTFNNDDRVHNSQSFWKGVKQTSGLIKLIAQGNGLYDETLIRFIAGATDEYDGNYDAFKLLSSNPDVPQIYSLNNSKTTTFSINSLPEITGEIVIPLGFLVTTPGTYSISPSEMGIDAQYVYLEDLDKPSVVDLIKYPTYIFNFNDGVANNDRFLLRIMPKSTGIENITDREFQIYPNPSSGIVTFELNAEENTPIRVEFFNINGQKILTKLFRGGDSKVTIDLSPLTNGIYTVKISSEGKTDFRKLILMK